ncbi:protease inhibitor I9 family protein [Streptomyces sp. NPDC003042]
MRPFLRPVLATALLLTASLCAAPAAYAAGPEGVSAAYRADDDGQAGTYIVTLAREADPHRVMRETGVERARFVFRHAVRGFAADLDGEQLAAVRAHPEVTGVERDADAVGAPVTPAGPAAAAAAAASAWSWGR